jgi:hypothetical protein
MTVKGTAHVAHNYTNTTNAYKSSNKIFLGFKNSSEIFERLRFESNGNDTSYQQPHAIREQFAYHTYDSKIQKNNLKFTHSLYSNVQKYDNSICGTYLTLSDFALNPAGDYTKDFTINMIIPLADILALQCFED